MSTDDKQQPARHELQRTGSHPAPCARFCEAVAFTIQIRGLEAERDALRAEVARITGEWAALSQDEGKAAREIERLTQERDALRDALFDIASNGRDSSAQGVASRALVDTQQAVARPKPLDDTHLQSIFSDAIRGALALGAGNECPPPVGHWLAPWWQQGRDVAAAAAPVAQPLTCTWRPDADIDMKGTWSSDCGAVWSFIDGGPVENRMRNCPECGKLVSVPVQEGDAS